MRRTLSLLIAVLTMGVLVGVWGAGTRTSDAEVDGSAAVWCGFFAALPQPVSACDGLTDAEIITSANQLGDEDDLLETGELDDIDFDANQLTDGGAFSLNEIILFAFVDNDGMVTFDANPGLSIAVQVNGADQATGADGNFETCDDAVGSDLDCDTSILDDGNGVVTAVASDGTADAGDDVDVDIFQADDTNQVSTETLAVVGAADEIQAVALKDTIGFSGSPADVDDCVDGSDATDFEQLDDVNRTFVAATVTDLNQIELTRISVGWSESDSDILQVAGDTFVTIDAGDAGVAAFAVVCGGETSGIANVTAELPDEDASVEIAVVGPPAGILLTATPAAVRCDGIEVSTVTAFVIDADANGASDGTPVNFSVVADGITSPINTVTSDGSASSVITPFEGVSGVTVVVSAGDAQASIRIDCKSEVAAIDLAATPPNILCDGVQLTAITATVRDSNGAFVADGTVVEFLVYAVGITSPIRTLTLDGQAFSTFRGISGATVGVPIYVTAGDVTRSILITCNGFDTDGDGMANVYEATLSCLNPDLPDSHLDQDADSLTSLNEHVVRGTDPCAADTDGDQCGDGYEVGLTPADGGDRDPLQFWDFFDVTGDSAIDLADTIAVLQRFGLGPGAPGYSALFDRVAPNPTKLWRTAPATGAALGIDVSDALLNLQSFGHNCV